MRWRQTRDENGNSVFIPMDEAAAKHDGVTLSESDREHSHFVHGDIAAFVSPVDGTVISDRKQLDEHNRRNNVVNASEMTGHWERAAKERERIASGNLTRGERHEIRREIYENTVRAERGLPLNSRWRERNLP